MKAQGPRWTDHPPTWATLLKVWLLYLTLVLVVSFISRDELIGGGVALGMAMLEIAYRRDRMKGYSS